ncbi:MAG: hypothetical protein P1U39_06095 [Legionellaceae bacterium]|nr:hypothetical protein [Legionellaceae bacterium]
MKTMDELIAASEADIGPILTQMIVDGDVADPAFDNYIFTQPPSNAAACLAAALGDNEVLCELGFPLSCMDTDRARSNQVANYNVIQTLIEYNHVSILNMSSVHRVIFKNASTFKPYVEQALSTGDFQVLNYFVQQNPGKVMDSLSHELIDRIFYLMETQHISVPENRAGLSAIVRALMQYSSEHVSEEQMLLWQTQVARWGVGEENAEADMPKALKYLTRSIPQTCCDKENILEVDSGVLDNTKACLIYFYAQKRVPEEMLSHEACCDLLYHLEIDNLSEPSSRYLREAYKVMEPVSMMDSIFMNPEAELSTLSMHFKFYTLLSGGVPEEALSYFESIPKEVRSGEAWFHYSLAVLKHVDALPDEMIQESLEKVISALQHAEELGSDLAKNFLVKSFDKHDDGSIVRSQMQVAVDGGGKRKFDAFKIAYQSIEDDESKGESSGPNTDPSFK